MASYKRYRYGSLNKISTNLSTSVNSSSPSFLSNVRESVAATINTTLQNMTKFKAIVLRIEKETSGDPTTWDKILSPDSNLVRIRCRIPEIDSVLPEPEDLGVRTGPSARAIDMHRTYVAANEELTAPSPGDIVWVEFTKGYPDFTDGTWTAKIFTPSAESTGGKEATSAESFGECGGQLGADAPTGNYSGGLSAMQKYGLSNPARQDFTTADLVKVSPEELKACRGKICLYPADDAHADPQMDILLETNSPIAYLIRMVSGFRASTGKYSRHFDSTTTDAGISLGFPHFADGLSGRRKKKGMAAIELLQRLARANPEEAKIAFGDNYPDISNTRKLLELNVPRPKSQGGRSDDATQDGLVRERWVRDGFYTLARRDWAMVIQVEYWAQKILRPAYEQFSKLGWTDLRGLALLVRARNSSRGLMFNAVKAARSASGSQKRQIEAAMQQYANDKNKPGRPRGDDRIKRLKAVIPEGIEVTEFPDVLALNYGAPLIRNGVKVERRTDTIVTPSSNGNSSIEAPKEGVPAGNLTTEEQEINNPTAPQPLDQLGQLGNTLFGGFLESADNKLKILVEKQVPKPAPVETAPCVSSGGDAAGHGKAGPRSNAGPKFKGAKTPAVRIAKRTPKFVVLHTTEANYSGKTDDWIAQKWVKHAQSRNVSTHFVIRKDGKILMLLDPIKFSANHGGKGANSGVGIDLDAKVGDGSARGADIPDAAMKSLAKLLNCQQLRKMVVTGHWYWRFTNRTDPGLKFPYDTLIRAGVSEERFIGTYGAPSSPEDLLGPYTSSSPSKRPPPPGSTKSDPSGGHGWLKEQINSKLGPTRGPDLYSVIDVDLQHYFIDKELAAAEIEAYEDKQAKKKSKA